MRLIDADLLEPDADYDDGEYWGYSIAQIESALTVYLGDMLNRREAPRMRSVKCSDCDEYRNEWCEKVIDSPHPDMIRDCQYWHKRKDIVEVVRCKDCKYSYIHYPFGEDVFGSMRCRLLRSEFSKESDLNVRDEDYCSRAERREDPEEQTRVYWCENERYEIPERREE